MKIGMIIASVFMIGIVTGCKKEVRGVCVCKYLSGDKVEFDYSHLTIDQANAKCDSTSNNASAFAGSCKLE